MEEVLEKYTALEAISAAEKDEAATFIKSAADRVKYGKALSAEALLHHGLSQGKEKGPDIVRSVLAQVAGNQVCEELVSACMLEAARQTIG